MLRWSGGRISEVLALTPAAIDIESGVSSVQTLKRRKKGIIRQVPLPGDLINDLTGFFELREKQRDAYVREQAKREQAVIDDLFLSRRGRRN